jgi:hypothetical protein
MKAHQIKCELEPIPKKKSNKNKKKKDKKAEIWQQGDENERKRIRQFWVDLGLTGRKSLCKLEKYAVLKKMKEQQKQSCSCQVCGRRRYVKIF